MQRGEGRQVANSGDGRAAPVGGGGGGHLFAGGHTRVGEALEEARRPRRAIPTLVVIIIVFLPPLLARRLLLPGVQPVCEGSSGDVRDRTLRQLAANFQICTLRVPICDTEGSKSNSVVSVSAIDSVLLPGKTWIENCSGGIHEAAAVGSRGKPCKRGASGRSWCWWCCRCGGAPHRHRRRRTRRRCHPPSCRSLSSPGSAVRPKTGVSSQLPELLCIRNLYQVLCNLKTDGTPLCKAQSSS